MPYERGIEKRRVLTSDWDRILKAKSLRRLNDRFGVHMHNGCGVNWLSLKNTRRITRLRRVDTLVCYASA